VLGFMALKQGVPVEAVAKSGKLHRLRLSRDPLIFFLKVISRAHMPDDIYLKWQNETKSMKMKSFLFILFSCL